jgi:uncharacterized protein YdbL (DUF1318 family)
MIRRASTLLSLVAALVLWAGVALAGPLDGPKEEGLIGERPDGYVGFVADEVPADVKKLVDRTNKGAPSTRRWPSRPAPRSMRCRRSSARS